MNSDFKKRLMRSLILAVIALLIGMGIGFYQVGQQGPAVVNKGSQPMDVAGVQVGGDFTLVSHAGETVTQDEYAGQYKLIYFGFTYCPAICPTELQKITKALNALPADMAAQIQPLFITIDPERDTIEVMRGYVEMFHPRMVGLTGSRDQIDQVLRDYRIYASKVQEPEMNDYTMDHSSFIYLMSRDNQLMSIYRIEDDAAFIAKDIVQRLGNG